ncbi:hypothetical protein EOM09_06665 [bacterium]|nr:hypothetical protein [bacterium]
MSINYLDLRMDSNNDGRPDFNKEYNVRIFLHDNKKNESREITEEQAQKLYLSELITSPEGISVSDGYSNNADILFLFGGGSSYEHYLTKGNKRKKLNLIDDNSYRRGNFKFIGWVINK